MEIDAETSGWAIELNPAMALDGKPVSALEVQFFGTRKLEALDGDRQVRAKKGILCDTSGVETGKPGPSSLCHER